MIIFGTKTVSSVLKVGQFQCPNCKNVQNYKLKRYKKYFHIAFIPLVPISDSGDGVECRSCSITYIPGTVLPNDEYSPDNPLGISGAGSYPRLTPSGFGARLGAYLIDIFLIYVIEISTRIAKIGIGIPIIGLIPIIGFIYFTVCDVFLKGSSLGKLILKIKISEFEEDKLPKLQNLLIRNSIKGICGLFPPIYFLALADINAQTIHDRAANTMVISKVYKPA